MRKADRITSVFLILFSLYFTIEGYGYGLFRKNGETGAGLIPFGVGLLLLLFSVILFVKSFVSNYDDNKEEKLIDKDSLHVFLIYICSLIVALFLARYIGLIIPMFVMTFAMIFLAKMHSWKKALIISLGTTIFIYCLFDLILGVPVPTLFLNL